MKKIFILFFFQTLCAVGHSQIFPIAKFGIPLPARADLDVRWNVARDALPHKAWSYRVLPNQFSPKVISYLMMIGSFTDKDKKVHSDTNGMTFQSSDGSRNLSISFSSSHIYYDVAEPHYSPTNLAQDVPSVNQLPKLVKNVLHKLGISLSDVRGYSGASKLEYSEPERYFFVSRTTITNISYGMVGFRRSIDSALLAGNNAWDGINFGEHGKIIHIHIIWPKLERIKRYPLATPETMMKWIREGKAIQQPVHGNQLSVDWTTVKSVTVTRADVCYATGLSTSPFDKLYPHAALWTTVDTENGKVDVEIDCPIIDEDKPLK